MLFDFLPQIKSMPSVSLPGLDAVALQNRIDSKYVLNTSQLAGILPFIVSGYEVLEIDGHRVFTYENNYFDTDDLQFYYDHHNGYVNRMKVRSRRYVETGSAFFEIKKKEKVERTNKIREAVPDVLLQLDDGRQQTVRAMTRKGLGTLSVLLTNNFNRITFVNHARTERMTLDFNIRFADGKQEKSLSSLYVLEMKRSRAGGLSAISETLKKQGIREQGFSKYVFGILSLREDVRRNNFLPLLKNINAISEWNPKKQ